MSSERRVARPESNFLVPIDNTGIRDDVTPTFAVEWSF
jgi:hypothetical protein